jgi:hypothetical protein
MGNEIKRMNYLDGLLLKSEDYNLDKEYQRRLLGLHNRYLHSFGIADGLEVKPVNDSNMEVYVTEGAALDITDGGLDGTNIEESTGRLTAIYEGHPDNPVDLSEYTAGEDIYIYITYFENNADWDSEKGQGQEIHIWELGKINHSTKKPEDTKKNILLARVRPKEIIDSEGNKETVIDNQCIYYIDIDGSQLRQVVGSQSRVLGMNKINFKLGEDDSVVPAINTSENSDKDLVLDIDSKLSSFTGEVNAQKDFSFEGVLICLNKDGKVDEEMELDNSFLELNKYEKDSIPDNFKLKNAGLDVCRGGPGIAPDARIAWSEKEKVWKAGFENSLSTILYGPKCEELIGNIYNCDKMHNHSSLSSKKGTSLAVNSNGILSANANLTINSKKLKFSSGSKGGELEWNSNNEPFEQIAIDGPLFVGDSSGALGTTSGEEKVALSWNSKGKWGKVGIGSINLSRTDDELDIAGSFRLLADSNPIRITSSWTAFPDRTKNHAEICNDTTYHKALMIVGNQSAGQGRKVAIWDRLDVASLLYINGSMEMSKILNVTAGTGNNGIVFPDDPGGGSGDGAWIKYYPKAKDIEDCTFEIGTSNDRDDNIVFNASGGVGIGTKEPKEKFDVMGKVRILGENNPLRFTDNWSSFTVSSPYNSEISNDAVNYKSLMIAGNRTGGNERRVKVYDDLDVNGVLAVNKNIQVNGAIIPGIGNCEVKGIMFPKDPGGGSGDAAWIRYFSDTLRGGGGNMTLEIGIANDSNIETRLIEEWVSKCPWGIPNGCGYWNRYYRTFVGNGGDRLRLHASGGVFVDGNFYITSSREYKENITKLSKTKATEAINSLEPVEFNFKGDSQVTIGFIAEEISNSLAAYDKKAIDPMEIITVLVEEVKAQENELKAIQKKIASLKRRRK